MAESILIDTSVFIDFFRKSKKENSYWFQLAQDHQRFAVSVITQYEIHVGADAAQFSFWEELFKNVIVLPFDEQTSRTAVRLARELRSTRQMIDLPDLFIAATALTHNLPLATLNQKHFVRVAGLNLLEI